MLTFPYARILTVWSAWCSLSAQTLRTRSAVHTWSQLRKPGKTGTLGPAAPQVFQIARIST